jgi:hypothetical protein
LTVVGHYAYVVSDPYYLQVIRVANPSRPVEVGRCRLIATRGVSVSDGYAYVAANGTGLWVISVVDPACPDTAGYYHLPGQANGVIARGDLAYVAYGEMGLQIFQYLGTGIEESPGVQMPSRELAATVVRELPAGAVAFDALGRRVSSSKPGVYFVRAQSRASNREVQAVRKVIVAR